MIFQSIAIALDMLRQHKFRAFLTMLGVIIGVMAVTIIVMISSGFQSYMKNEFQKLGADTMFVFFDPGRDELGRTTGAIDGLTNDDVDFLLARVPELDIAAPMIMIPQQKVMAGDRNVPNPRIYASNEYFLELNRLRLLEGRFFNAADMRERANVCVIGPELSERLFPDRQAIGRLISFRDITFEVVGIMERVDIMGETTARDVLVPLTTAQDKWLGGDNVSLISTRPKPGITVQQAMDATWRALMMKSNNRPIYRVDSRESILNVFGAIFGVAGAILAAIAALSLLVGGIGIMNIMLVSVTERTREIGLRKAMGAKRGSILVQFLVESAMLSLVGGLIGMAIAWMIGNIVSLITATTSWPSAGGLALPFPVAAAIMAAAFSAFIGIVFGFYPAFTAAKLDPIVALRRE
jgi:putative ABC transport system permease protein